MFMVAGIREYQQYKTEESMLIPKGKANHSKSTHPFTKSVSSKDSSYSMEKYDIPQAG